MHWIIKYVNDLLKVGYQHEFSNSELTKSKLDFWFMASKDNISFIAINNKYFIQNAKYDNM